MTPITGSDFFRIPSPHPQHLCYSVVTRAVYLINEFTEGDVINSLLGPYIRNGHFCEFIGGEILEVIPPAMVTKDF